MSRILLLRPPMIFSSTSLSSPVALPVGLAYLAAVLREKGHQVQVIDALGEDIDRMERAWNPRVLCRGLSVPDILERIDPRVDAIGVSAMFSQEWPHIENLILAVHRAFPHIPIIVGGEHATAASEYILTSCPAVSFVARGEGEDTILQFAEYLDGKRALERVAGIWWRGESGQVVRNAPAERLRSIDELPWPAWDLFPVQAYFGCSEGHGVQRGRAVTMLATRGCPYDCTFCSSPTMWTRRYVLRQVNDVVDEMEHYARRYGAENIDFADLTAVVKKSWVIELCQEIRRRGLRLSWQLPSGTRSEALDDEVLTELAASGCLSLTYAPESGSERTLREIKKQVNLPRMIESMKSAKARGIFVKANFIIGFPRETRADVWRTLGLTVKLAWIGVDDMSLYPLAPYPGSEIFDYLRGTGAIKSLDRGYYESLMAFMDVRMGNRYCENIGPRELSFYQAAGMALFYALSYLLYPSRLLRTWRNYRDRRSDSVFEMRVFALLRRWRRLREPAPRREAAQAHDRLA